MTENRYRAVLEVLIGGPVTEVARRYGVPRQTIYVWCRRYRQDGVEGLQGKSRRPAPARLAWPPTSRR
ncbi:helix-turn-helix domain-containing protein [Actinomadura sp. NEAU-AAG5]|uniref:Helix-turn-helix domain-containing protein n=1 Tax=Actinomadura litoris TaxID=2678616 RepID=A0A7K1KTC3_9ACTN|nr:helix-turn-helix domain-containing protein [Actinomadura litoris]